MVDELSCRTKRDAAKPVENSILLNLEAYPRLWPIFRTSVAVNHPPLPVVKRRFKSFVRTSVAVNHPSLPVVKRRFKSFVRKEP